MIFSLPSLKPVLLHEHVVLLVCAESPKLNQSHCCSPATGVPLQFPVPLSEAQL